MHPIQSDFPFPEALVVPDHSIGPSDFIAMSNNLANQPIKDRFLYWRQETEAKQEEQAKQMAELCEHTNRLQQANEFLRTRLETNQGENSRGPIHHAPPTQPNKGKEPILMGESDPLADDKLSSGSSPLLDRSPPQNNTEAESKKRPPRRSSQSVSGMRRRVRREASRDIRHSKLAPEYVPFRLRGMAPQFPPAHHPFGVASVPHLVSFSVVRGLEDMLSSPLGPHISSYEPPRGFTMSSFSMYDDSTDPYDHMLHFNQTMILNAGNDRLLCKVFPASLKGPALAWFHKLPRGSINSFSELWVVFISQYLCSVRHKGNISLL